MVYKREIYFLLCITSYVATAARVWNDTGSGTIVFEEAWIPPELLSQVNNTVPPVGQTPAELQANLLDIHNQRLSQMDTNAIDFMILSCASPCIQGITDPSEANGMAVMVNNELALSILNNTFRFGAFAALSMHNASTAAAELNRTVSELGFFGALLNDYQVAGTSDNPSFLFYDHSDYDVFWQMVTDLDVPVYFHPRSNPAPISTLFYDHATFLKGPGQEFAVTLSNHILSLCVNGVFDRFPSLKIIVGHLGERIPSDLLRIDEQLQRQLVEGMPMLKNVSDYWRTNIFETTSGNFATDLLLFHQQQVGLDRIMYSIDYPYVVISDGTQWLGTLNGTLTAEEILALKRETAIELFRLNT